MNATNIKADARRYKIGPKWSIGQRDTAETKEKVRNAMRWAGAWEEDLAHRTALVSRYLESLIVEGRIGNKFDLSATEFTMIPKIVDTSRGTVFRNWEPRCYIFI